MKRARLFDETAVLNKAARALKDALRSVEPTEEGVQIWPSGADGVTAKAKATCAVIASTRATVLGRYLDRCLFYKNYHPHTGQQTSDLNLNVEFIPDRYRKQAKEYLEFHRYLSYLLELCELGTLDGPNDLGVLLQTLYLNYGVSALAPLIILSVFLDYHAQKKENATCLKRLVTSVFNLHCTNNLSDDPAVYNAFVSGDDVPHHVLRSLYAPNRVSFGQPPSIRICLIEDRKTDAYVWLHTPQVRFTGRPNLNDALPMRVFGQGPTLPPEDTPTCLPAGAYCLILDDDYAHYWPTNKPLPTEVKDLYEKSICFHANAICRFEVGVVIYTIQEAHNKSRMTHTGWISLRRPQPYDTARAKLVTAPLPQSLPEDRKNRKDESEDDDDEDDPYGEDESDEEDDDRDDY